MTEPGNGSKIVETISDVVISDYIIICLHIAVHHIVMVGKALIENLLTETGEVPEEQQAIKEMHPECCIRCYPVDTYGTLMRGRKTKCRKTRD